MSQSEKNDFPDLTNQKALIDVIVNRLNPRYRKEIIEIPDEVIPRKLFENEDFKKLFVRDNLRGLGRGSYEFSTCDTGLFYFDEKYLVLLPDAPLDYIESIIKINEKKLVILEGGSATVLRIDDPYNLKVLDIINIEENIHYVLTVEKYILFVASGKVLLLNKNFEYVGEFEIKTSVENIIVINEKLLAFIYDSNIELINIANIRKPNLLKNIEINSKIFSVSAISENRLTIATKDKILFLDISDIHNILIFGNYKLKDNVYIINKVSQKLLFVVYKNGITLLDITNINKPKSLASYLASGIRDVITINKNTLAVIEEVYGDIKQVTFLDITNYDNIKQLGKYNIGDCFKLSLSVIDEKTLIVGRDDKIELLDISELKKPYLLGMYREKDWERCISNYSKDWISIGGNEVILLNIANFNNLRFKNFAFENLNLCHVSAISENILIGIQKFGRKVTLIDITKSQNPKIKDIYESAEDITSLATINENKFVVGSGHKVILIDITESQNPKIKDIYESAEDITSLATINENKFVVAFHDEVVLLDTKNTGKSVIIFESFGYRILNVLLVNEEILVIKIFKNIVVILDVSNYHIAKKIGVCLILNDGIIEIITEKKWLFYNPKGWEFGNDPMLYRYARLYDPEADRLIPYYSLNEKRCTLSDDGTTLVIKRNADDEEIAKS